MEMVMEDRLLCDNCARYSGKNEPMIERETILGDIYYYHFECALSSKMITSEYLMKLCRRWKKTNKK